MLADAVSGFSFGQTVDPVNGNQGGALDQRVLASIGLAMFLAIGGDAWMLRGHPGHVPLVPLGKGPRISSLVGRRDRRSFGTVFVGAVEVAAPILLALVSPTSRFGMVAKVSLS